MEQGADVRRVAPPAAPDDPAGAGHARSERLRRRDARIAADRWAWRRTIRSDPRKYRVYRVVVAVVGVLLVLLGLSTGWLPGPGGIPLTLLGLAVLASEFEWAHRLLQWARRKAHDFTTWSRELPRWLRALGGVVTAAVLVAIGWLALTLLGVPSWVPTDAAAVLQVLPGVP